MNKVKILLQLSFFIMFFFTVPAVFAQSGVIKGKIIDAKTNETLIGATVVIKGTTTGSAADLDGNFIIPKAPVGTHTLVVSSVGYQTVEKNSVLVESGKETILDLSLASEDIVLEAVEVVARINRESETALLLEQRQALVATQSVGVRELSRKGIGDAEAAVAQVSGVSRQEGVKNVFVRGLGDRYNVTLLNGFPIPSEDPEYKNIALEFFGTDVIQSIGANKVFNAGNYSDVGGAIINISSKELVGNSALGFDLSGGINTAATATAGFLHQEGSNYFGFANTRRPAGNQYDFSNSLDPQVVSFPFNHSYGISGGKSFQTGGNGNPLSFFVTASHSNNYSYTKETIRSSTTTGTIYQDQTGSKYSQSTSQLVLGNVMYGINRKHNLEYNVMLIHANDQYVGEYRGYNERYQDSPDYIGFTRRQQTNDNLLLVNQLMSDWQLSRALKLDVGVSYNMIKSFEPDRRQNSLSHQESGAYILTGGAEQRRSFSTLADNDFNVKAGLTYKLKDRFDSNNSVLKAGYNGRFDKNEFKAFEYTFYTSATEEFDIENLKLDNVYNLQNMEDGKFQMIDNNDIPASYYVTKNIHSGYVEASYQLLKKLTGNIGFRMDKVDLSIDCRIPEFTGIKEINRNYFLPSFNLKYDMNDKNSLRLGAGKTYTLPQAKEFSPYRYVNISFSSAGDPNIQPSDNYNADLKWDYYISSGELISLTGFYKYIKNPIGRVDEGNSAGLLTYTNISNHAAVGGVEMEVRKNIFNRFNTQLERVNRLSVGLNASCIYTNLKLNIRNTESRNSALEGASPFLANMDLSYNYTEKDKNLIASLVFSYFSDRIHTLGAGGFNDIVEEGVPVLDFAASYKFNKHITLKAQIFNLLDPSFRLTRENSSGENIVLNEYKKGQNISLGVSCEF